MHRVDRDSRVSVTFHCAAEANVFGARSADTSCSRLREDWRLGRDLKTLMWGTRSQISLTL